MFSTRIPSAVLDFCTREILAKSVEAPSIPVFVYLQELQRQAITTILAHFSRFSRFHLRITLKALLLLLVRRLQWWCNSHTFHDYCIIAKSDANLWELCFGPFFGKLCSISKRMTYSVLYGYKQKAETAAMHEIFERKELLMAEYVQGHNRESICLSDGEDFYQWASLHIYCSSWHWQT